jgi:hypothetical protein
MVYVRFKVTSGTEAFRHREITVAVKQVPELR